MSNLKGILKEDLGIRNCGCIFGHNKSCMETVKYDLCLLQDVNGLTTMYRFCTSKFAPSKLADTGPPELLLGIVVEPCSE